MRTRLLAIVGAATLIAPAAAHAQNPLSSIFNCTNPNSRQQGGAVAGALLGGILGSQVDDDNRATGAILGGLLGAAAGSAIGCNMTSTDTTRATDATRQALDTGRSTTWRNPANGTSGRIDIVNTYSASDASARSYDPYYNDRYDTRYDSRYDNRYDRYDDRYGYRRPTSLADVQFAYGVTRPGSNYQMSDATYQARSRTNVRAAPTRNSQVVTTLSSGERFDALATVGANWLLASRNGQAIGYVSADVVSRVDSGYGYNRDYAYDTSRNGSYRTSQLCRVFDQTVTRSGYSPTTQRFTACQSANGEWIIQS